MELFNGTINVAYSQFYIHPEDLIEFDMNDAFRGQANGLCGAAAAPLLFFTTGLHTGHVRLSIHLNDSEPALSEEWEEAVEVPLEVAGELCLTEWGEPSRYPLPIPHGRYRLRYAGINMDAAKDADCIFEDAEAIDRYRIDLWPVADTAGDRIIRQHGEQAAYWHGAWS